MVDPSLTIAIDRTSLSLSPLVLDASATSGLGITDYQEPAMLPRINYAPSSEFVHGDLALGWTWQQTVIPFAFITLVDTEAESRELVAEVLTAITQFPAYQVTKSIADAADETWWCDPGSLAPNGSRTRVNIQYAIPEWSVTIPAFPVRSVA